MPEHTATVTEIDLHLFDRAVVSVATVGGKHEIYSEPAVHMRQQCVLLKDILEPRAGEERGLLLPRAA